MDTLFSRFRNQGTLAEPDGIPDPTFALPSTVNWMKALSLVSTEENVCFGTAKAFFASHQKRKLNEQELNTTYEQLILAIHCLASLRSMKTAARISDIARMASVAWYYGIYYSASAMIVAKEGTQQDTHTKTANVWDSQFVRQGNVMPPFNLAVSNLTNQTIKAEIALLKNGNSHKLTSTPTDRDTAWGALCEYLSGSANWWKWRTEEDLKKQKSFRALNVDNFRTKAARQLRDEALQKRQVSFMHQAFRYRGKANYREALFLAYGENTESTLTDFTEDLSAVLEAFLAMAGAFVFKKIGKKDWEWFVNELSENKSFSLEPKDIWPAE